MLRILWRDERLIALHKPAGWLVHRTGLDAGETRIVLQTLCSQLGG
jgi:tRNA pseudouridine65 synthase